MFRGLEGTKEFETDRSATSPTNADEVKMDAQNFMISRILVGLCLV